MDEIIRAWIVEIIERRKTLLAVAIRQRAKFEGWLKFELAAHAERKGARDVEVEASPGTSGSGRFRVDIAFVFGDTRYNLEIKTPNSNWRLPGVLDKIRPITKNIAEIINDAKKLAECPGRGLVAFVLFPVPPKDRRWIEYLERIASELDISLTEDDHTARVNVPLRHGYSADLIVSCFEVKKH
jgi:hypothetical protein